MYHLPILDVQWFRKLNSEIWKREYRNPTKWHDGWHEGRRRLMTPWEMLWVFRKAKKHHLPAVMADNMSVLTIYHHHDIPLFERRRDHYGLPIVAPEKLISITPGHLYCHRNNYTMVTKKYPKGVPDYYHAKRFGRLFSRLTHCESNLKMLEWYGFEKPTRPRPNIR